MNNLPIEIITKIYGLLHKKGYKGKQNLSQLSFVAAFDGINIDWKFIFLKRNAQKRNKGLKIIHNAHFQITTKKQLKEMRIYYKRCIKAIKKHETNDDIQWDYRNIPICHSSSYKLEDYIYEIEDTIYDEIFNLAKKDLNKIQN